MPEYIDRNVLKRVCKGTEIDAIMGRISWRDAWKAVCERIRTIPAADVSPTVPGEWVRVECGTFCTNCTRVFDMHFEIPQNVCERLPRCPNCGARMNAKEGNE